MAIQAADVLAAGAEDRVHAIWHAALVLVAALLVAEHAGPPGVIRVVCVGSATRLSSFETPV